MKIVVADLPSSKRSRASRDPRHRFVRRSDGKIEKRYVIDTASPDFSEQFLTVFRRNVARARRQRDQVQRDPAE